MSAVQSLTVACVVTMEQYLPSELQLTTPTHLPHMCAMCVHVPTSNLTSLCPQWANWVWEDLHNDGLAPSTVVCVIGHV